MKRDEIEIFADSALRNKGAVALHAFAGLATIVATLAFTSLLALYFDIDIFKLKEHAPSLISAVTKTHLIVGALIASVVLLTARVSQSLIEAKVTISREKWFAEKIRSGELKGMGNPVRASNYYGRLSSASMKSASTIVVLILNLFTIILVLPKPYSVVIFLIIAVCFSILFLAMRFLSSHMSRASDALATNGKQMSQWKTDTNVSYGASVKEYYAAYFNRLFLGATLSFAPSVFGIAFCLGLLVAQELGTFQLNLGVVFVAFTLLQANLNAIGKFFGSFVHGAAFLPAIKPFLVGTGTQSVRTPFTQDEIEIE